MARSPLGGALDELAVGGIGVTEGDELAPGGAGGQRHAAGDLHAHVQVELLGAFQVFVAGHIAVALDFDIDLVDGQLVGHVGPSVRVGAPAHPINGHDEIGVMARHARGGRER